MSKRRPTPCGKQVAHPVAKTSSKQNQGQLVADPTLLCLDVIPVWIHGAAVVLKAFVATSMPPKASAIQA